MLPINSANLLAPPPVHTCSMKAVKKKIEAFTPPSNYSLPPNQLHKLLLQPFTHCPIYIRQPPPHFPRYFLYLININNARAVNP